MHGTEELERQRRDIIEEIEATDTELTSLRDQIERAKAERAIAGSYANPDWWARVNSRLRHRGRDRQSLQTRLADVNRALKTAHHRVNTAISEATFIRVAKERLPADTFMALMTETKARQDANLV